MEQCLYYVLNTSLRSKDRQDLKPWLSYLRLLLNALSRLPSTCSTVYRQVEINVTEKYPLENRFIWWAFSLCTQSMTTTESNPINLHTLFEIECHSGKDIRQHSYFPDEDQILFIAASEFQVMSSVPTDNGQQRIHLKELPNTNSHLQLNKNSKVEEVPLSASALLNISQTNVQSRSRVETIEKYIKRILRLQHRIEESSLYSSIDLANENLDDQDISLVIQHAIIIRQCSILRLDKNFITSTGIAMLASALEDNTTLLGLNLTSNRLFDKGLHPFVKLLSNNHSNLRKLHLGSNRISNEGALLLAEILKTNTKLIILWLDSNRIDDEGVDFLADALIHHNRTLEELSLKKNKLITSLSVPYFRDVFQRNQSLIEVDLSFCALKKEDMRHLRSLSNENKRFVFQSDAEEIGDCTLS